MNMTMKRNTSLYNVAEELAEYGDAFAVKGVSTLSARVSDLRKMGFTIRSPRKDQVGRYTVSKTMRNKLAKAVAKAV